MAAVKENPTLDDLFDFSPAELKVEMARHQVEARVNVDTAQHYVLLQDQITCRCCGSVTHASRGLFLQYKERGATVLRAVKLNAKGLPPGIKYQTDEVAVDFCAGCPILESYETSAPLELSKSKGAL